MTPEEHRHRFIRAMKRKDEGWAQFASRLTSHFSYYIEARETKTLEALIELMVADRFKECLSPEAQRHVTLREEGGWLRAHEMSKIIDTFEVAEGKAKSKGAGDADSKKGQKTSSSTSNPKWPPRCYVSNEGSHLARDCLQRSQKDARDKKLHVQSIRAGHTEETRDEEYHLVARIGAARLEGPKRSRCLEVTLDCGGANVCAVLDTGSEVTVMRASVVPPELWEPSGTIKLVSAFGQEQTARLARLPISLRLEGEVSLNAPVSLLCAVTEQLAPQLDCLLSIEDWERLLGTKAVTAGPPVVSAAVSQQHNPPKKGRLTAPDVAFMTGMSAEGSGVADAVNWDPDEKLAVIEGLERPQTKRTEECLEPW
ncbi:hypothetical protein ISCGN_031733 [Ixodes scapularis]